MPRLRLCLLFPHVVLGGGETATMTLAEGLAGDFDVTLAALDYWEGGVGVTIREELTARFGDVRFLRHRHELRPALGAVDAVLWYGVTGAIPKALAALGEGRPASVRIVHTDREADGVAFTRRWRRVIDATVCVSPAVARQIPGAVFIPNPAPRRYLEGEGCDFFRDDRKTLGFLGRLVPLKNVRWLVGHLGEIGCNLLLQALDTPLERAADLERLARERGVGDRVRFLPPGRDVGTLLRSVDALAVVSRHEGFPRVVVEAGTLGVPVVATRVGALPELFADEVLFVDSCDGVPAIASLREAVERVGPGWGLRLQERVRRLCDVGTVAERYADVVRRVRERRPQASNGAFSSA